MEKIPYLGQTLIRWRAGGSTFVALPEKGARLMNWNIAMGDGSVRDVIHWPEIASLEAFHKARGGNPILFPFCARSFDRGEIGFWRDARGRAPADADARLRAAGRVPGDARRRGGFEAVLRPGDEAKACYPFQYEFRVAYRFAALGLTCTLSLENLGDEPLPWSAGHHFYFTLPWSEGVGAGDYLIRIPAGERLRQDAAGQLVAGPAARTPQRADGQPARCRHVPHRAPEPGGRVRREGPARATSLSGWATRTCRPGAPPSSPGRRRTTRRSTASSPGWAPQTRRSTRSASTSSPRAAGRPSP
jgi:galactose mutarotase-like enzyme